MNGISRLFTGRAGFVAAGLTISVAIAAIWLARSSATHDQVSEAGVRRIDALERVQSYTAHDWVRTADAVVLGTVTDEKRHDPAESETVIGEGTDLVGRTVTIQRGDVLWRSADIDHVPPEKFTFDAAGWFTQKGQIWEAVVGDGSRLEVGHTYVLALVEMQTECGAGDPPTEGGWVPMGSGGALPADDNVIGHGEYLGTVSQRPDIGGLEPRALLNVLSGQPSDAVTASLTQLPPQERVDFQEGIQTC